MLENFYDKIYIGSGPILLLDAISKSKDGHKILVIDKSSEIGGAWKTIDIFGIKNLENAVHYLLPNEKTYRFLERNLKIKLCPPGYKKYFARRIFFSHFLIKTNSFFGILIAIIEKKKINFKNFIFNFFNELKEISSINKSRYPLKGSKCLINKINFLLLNSEVTINLNENIKSIKLSKNKSTEISTNKRKYYCKEIIISHGFIPPENMTINSRKININKKIYCRPSVHINYANKGKKIFNAKFSQVIFDKKSVLKYIHELGQFLEEKNLNENNFIIVAALKHNYKNTKNTKTLIIKELKNYKLIPKNVDFDDFHFYWQDIYLPMIDSSDLYFLERSGENKIKIMETEDLSKSFSNYSNSWLNLK